MNKKSLLIFAITLSLFGFSQNISFESSEGYTLGDINNQQSWTYWGSIIPNTAKIINTTATLGSNSANVISNNTVNNGGIKKNIVGFNNTEYSFDYKIEDIDGSTYYMAISDINDIILGAFVIDYIQGNLAIYDGILDDISTTSVNITPNTWYHFKMLINMTTHTVQYFVNNISLGSKNFVTSTTGVNIIDFVYDDFGTGFTIDNIKILDTNLLSTSEINRDKTVSIYPNPTSDFINIKTQDKINSVEIFDLTGKLVLKNFSGKEQISISHLQNGSYILKVMTKKSTYTKKINKK